MSQSGRFISDHHHHVRQSKAGAHKKGRNSYTTICVLLWLSASLLTYRIIPGPGSHVHGTLLTHSSAPARVRKKCPVMVPGPAHVHPTSLEELVAPRPPEDATHQDASQAIVDHL
jgi:hypothetical protein